MNNSKEKSDQKYFSNCEEVYELTTQILKTLYSKEISDIAIDLLTNGKSSIPEIQSRLKLSFENVRNYLIIMMQNNLVKKNLQRKKDIVLYEFNSDQIFHILLYPRSLDFINKNYGEYAKMIFEQFMEFGILNLNQITEQILNIISRSYNGGNNENKIETDKKKIIEIFIQLFENSFIIYSERTGENFNNNVNGNIKNKVDTNSNKKNKSNNKNNNSKSNNKNKKNNKSSNKKKKHEIENETINLEESENEDEDQKNNNINIIKSSSEDFYEKNTKNNMYFYINFPQLLTEFQSEIILDFISNSISHQAQLLASILLKNNKNFYFNHGKTFPMLIDTILQKYKSFTSNQIEEIIKNSNEFFIRSTSDDIILNIKKIKNEIKSKVIQHIISSKFSKEHLRVYNLLNFCGSLDGKNIMNICLIVPKKLNYIINQLYQEGFIKTDGVNFKGSNTLFYSVDEYQTTDNILVMDLKIINNLKMYYDEQLNNIKKKINNKKQNDELSKLSYIIDQICENIIIMKYF